MRDIFIFLCLIGMASAALWKPWLMTFTYLYTDLIQPQRLSYYLFRGVPLSLIIAIAAVLFFIADRKKNLRINIVQVLFVLFVLWFTFTTSRALIPDARAWFKWDAAWKAVIFGGVFLPMVLSTRRRIEAAVLLTVLCVALVSTSGAMKTLSGGGGYKELKMIVDVNKGLYESSTIGAVSVAIIPLMLYLFNHSPLVGKNIWTRIALVGLIASSLLIVVGTEARTGLVCLVAMVLMYFVRSRSKALFAVGIVVATAIAIPVLPQSFKDRMLTIAAPDEEISAATRTNVWHWTLNFVKDHPFGGGFEVNRITHFEFQLPVRGPDGTVLRERTVVEKARAFHSSYFEVLAEHGWIGLALYVSFLGGTLIQLGAMMRRTARDPPEERWRYDLAQALFRATMIYAVGGVFVGLATQTTLYMLLAMGLATMQTDATRREALARAARPAWRRPSALGTPAGLAVGT